MEEKKKKMIRVREFDMEKDLKAVEEMERRCDVGPATSPSPSEASAAKNNNKKKKTNSNKNKSNTMSLYVELLGDPLCRVRHTPHHVMLVAEYGEKKEMVGVIRACIKMVSRGRGGGGRTPTYTRVAYILGLRVSPTHRRLGVGMELVTATESWCVRNGAEYSYIATDRSNTASLSLFTRRLSYAPFRSLAILTQPVHSHPLRIPSSASVSLFRLPPWLSTPLYESLFSSAEFFPADVSSLLSHPSSLGTYLAVPSGSADPLRPLPASFAVMSLWNAGDTLRLRVSGAGGCARRLLRWARALDSRAPWMGVPSLRDVFSPFGIYLMYGLHMEGKGGAGLMRCLCRFAHNVAMEDKQCAAVVAEVAAGDPVRGAVPHWRRFSCEDDVWCMKRLLAAAVADDDATAGAAASGAAAGGDWSKSTQSSNEEEAIVFVDPREF